MGTSICFAPDATLFEKNTGHDAIRAHVRAPSSSARRPRRVPRLHFMSPAAIDGAGDSATAYSYLLWVTTGPSPCPVGAGARYEDTLKKNRRPLALPIKKS